MSVHGSAVKRSRLRAAKTGPEGPPARSFHEGDRRLFEAVIRAHLPRSRCHAATMIALPASDLTREAAQVVREFGGSLPASGWIFTARKGDLYARGTDPVRGGVDV